MSTVVGEDIYDRVIVDKPWGHEYLMFRNAHAALWCLHIREGASTSLHCHPRKKTGLVILSGSATVQFLNNASRLTAPANLMIRAGLFHQTQANLGTDVALIELESPVDKRNLVRLDDAYGRQKEPYEGVSQMRPLDDTCLRLPQPITASTPRWDFHGRVLTLPRVSDARTLAATQSPEDIVVVLDGGLFTHDREPILTAGDAVSSSTLKRLADAFESPEGLAALVIGAPAGVAP